MLRLSGRRARWAVPAIVVGTLAVGGIGYAAGSGSGDVIHGCYKNSNGSLRVVDGTASCDKKNETALDWNASGPEGPPGVSGYEIVTNEKPEDALGFFGSVSVTCPTGKNVLGGGAIAVLASGGVQSGFDVMNSSPLDDNGWRASFNIDNPFGDDFIMRVYAVCAYVS